MISEFKTIPKAVYYVQTAAGCAVLDPDGDTLAEITAPGGYFPGIAAADGGPGTVTFSAPVKRVVGPFDLAPQLQLTILGQLGGNGGLPAVFKRVEYLEGDGGQYIDTKRETTVSTRLEYECQLTATVGDPYVPIGASFREVNASGALVALHSAIYESEYGDNKIFFAFGNARTVAVAKTSLKNRHKVVVDKAKLWIDSAINVDLGVPDASFFDETITFYLFANHVVNEGTIHSADFRYKGRIFNMTIYDGDVKKNEFVPCVNKLTGEPCMFDLVTRRALYNSGSGDFTYPTATATYSLRRVLPDWGKLTENGLRRLYHAPASYQGELYDYAIENGYKPIVEPEMPEEGYWTPRWTETEEEIVLEWVETEPPMDDYLIKPT